MQRLIASSLHRQLDPAEAAAIDAALEEALSLLQAGGGAQRKEGSRRNECPRAGPRRRQPNAAAAQLWACAVDAAESAATSPDAFANAVIDGCSVIAAVLFTTAALEL